MKVSAILPLPPELIEFSLREPPRSLLIRGEPGAGKSTLALALLSSFRGKRILVSSRVTSHELGKDYPWLKTDVEGSVEIIEALTDAGRIEAKGRALDMSPSLVIGAPGDAELEKLWLPDSLIDAFSRLGPETPGMVVVDSWDALIEHFEGAVKPERGRYPDREEIERLMLGLLGRGRAHLVLVVEREGPTQLDYLVDGVVACVVSSDEDHLERWSHLKKMRGVRVNHAWYPFTLEGGRFLCIAPMPADYRTRLQRPQPEPDPKPGWIWPGSADFASHFGRLQYGRATLIEVDSTVPVEAVRLLVSPLQSQVLALNGHLLVVLPPSLSAGDVWEAFQSVVSPEQFVTNVRVYAPSGLAPHARNHDMLEKVLVAGPTAGVSRMTTRMPEATKFLREGNASGIPSLAVTWFDGLRAGSEPGTVAYTPENLPAIVQKLLTDSVTHLVMIGESSDPLLRSLQSIASTRISMRSRSGRVFLSGLQPLTSPLVLAQADDGTPYHLIRIV
jgi:KaiC/GvpD/RAD55 family RecA-like ATPase